MAKEIEPHRTDVYLFPPCLDDWIAPDHPARYIYDFVEALNLPALGFKVTTSDIGRPAYSERLLLRVWVYCYYNRIRSLRWMERACRDNVPLMWLTGNVVPDHNTLGRFWQRNRKAIRKVFKQSVRVAASHDLVGLVLHAIDGTRIRAQASADSAYHREKLTKALKRLDAVIDEFEASLGQADDSADGYRLPEKLCDAEKRREEIKAALAALDEADTNHLQPSDPDARVMKSDGTKAFAFNAQAVTDDKAGIIVAADVSNNENDVGELAPMLDRVKENTGNTAETTIADCGYSAAADLAAAEAKGNVVASMPKNVDPPPEEDPFHVSRFVYDEENDRLVCPIGKNLTFQRTKADRSGDGTLRVFYCRHYRDCPKRNDCCSGTRGRTVGLSEHHGAVERNRQKLKDPNARAKLAKRAVLAETPFAFVKEHLGFRRWSRRGTDAARTEWALVCTVLNLKKMYGIWAENQAAQALI